VFLEEITVNNFGLFSGSQTLQLKPPSIEKPVVIIGGLNGTGKTTLLDAIQLALYGKRARLSNRGALPYEEYLRRSINNGAINDETSIILQFRRWSDGVEQVFRISRTWGLVKDTIVEKVLVMRNGSLDKVLTDTWTEFVEEIIPIEIAKLFFFDGEKIERFADPQTSKQLLEKAINTLLGLDTVNRLLSDLIALERRKQISLKSDIERQKIIELENEIKKLNLSREDLIQQRAGCQNDVDWKSKLLREIQDNYQRSGGYLFDLRGQIEKERTEIKSALYQNESKLREIAEDVAPLLLVSRCLEDMNKQSALEEQVAKSTLVNEVLVERDNNLLQLINTLSVSENAISLIKDFFNTDYIGREESKTTKVYLNLSPECRQDLSYLQNQMFPQTKINIRNLQSEHNELHNKLVDVERKLAGVPAQDLVLELIAKRDLATQSLGVAENRLLHIDTELKRLMNVQESVQAKFNALLESTIVEQFDAEDTGRIIRHSQQARETIVKFRQNIIERHVGRISSLVLDSFRHLLRKDFMISDLTIDSKTFNVELYDGNGKTLSPERLSAGERQLLAVSLLWGLARASSYPLPVIIDTPLGRLDSLHRRKLVENYFPQASHQVILLSTNTEIDEEYFNSLAPFIGHAYHLEFDNQLKATKVKIGYFEGLTKKHSRNKKLRIKN
jgi:DNA sulfur modification protein DndD